MIGRETHKDIIPTVGVRSDKVIVDFAGKANFSCSPAYARELARLMIEVADLLDPPKKEPTP